MVRRRWARIWGLNWSDLRFKPEFMQTEPPTYWERLTYKPKRGPKALGSTGQIEHRMRQTFKRLYAAEVAVSRLHTAMGWWRLLNTLVYGWGY